MMSARSSTGRTFVVGFTACRLGLALRGLPGALADGHSLPPLALAFQRRQRLVEDAPDRFGATGLVILTLYPSIKFLKLIGHNSHENRRCLRRWTPAPSLFFDIDYCSHEN
jgi:hypothetical protein